MSDFTTDESNSRRNYFTMIPNMIGDMGLSVYAARLYWQIKSVAGDSGACWQSTRTLADICKMSMHKVVDAKAELKARGLINIEKRKNPNGGRDFDYITVVDVWADNSAKYEQVPVGNSQVPDGNLQVPDGNLQVPVVQRNKNQRIRTREEDDDDFSSFQEQSAFQERTDGQSSLLQGSTYDDQSKSGALVSSLQGGSFEQRKRKTTRNGNGVSLAERIAEELRKRGEEPSTRRIEKAIQGWGEKCDNAQKRGKHWSRTNIDGILDVYDTLRVPGVPGRTVIHIKSVIPGSRAE